VKNWEYRWTENGLVIDYDSVRRKVLYNLLVTTGTPMQLVSLSKLNLC
jgi:hypothetical protein